MEVKLAKSAGFCFGVKRAVDTVYEVAQKNEGRVFTLGPIIHNEQVVKDLENKNVFVCENLEDLQDEKDAILVIRSHGVSKTVIDDIKEKGISFEDATCPFVKKIHDIVHEYSEKDYLILVIGTQSHPEVQGILGWAKNKAIVIENSEQAQEFELEDRRKKICIVAQTTFNYKKFKDLVEIIEKKGYDIYAVNTVCNATATRQKEAAELSKECDCMLVIGGKHSSNTRKLYDICKNQCENTYFIQTVDDLRNIPLKSFTSLGITAGASTPNNIIQEVLRACQN